MAEELSRAGALAYASDASVIGLTLDSTPGRQAAGEVRARYEAELRRIAAELAGPEPSTSVRMLADSAVLDRFALRKHQAVLASLSLGQKGPTMVQSEFHQRRIDRTHRRYPVTLKTLATVRKLAAPKLQVNIARRQLNIAGPAPTPAIE